MQYRQVLILFIGYVLITFYLSYKVLAVMKCINVTIKILLFRGMICMAIGAMICIIAIQVFM